MADLQFIYLSSYMFCSFVLFSLGLSVGLKAGGLMG